MKTNEKPNPRTNEAARSGTESHGSARSSTPRASSFCAKDSAAVGGDCSETVAKGISPTDGYEHLKDLPLRDSARAVLLRAAFDRGYRVNADGDVVAPSGLGARVRPVPVLDFIAQAARSQDSPAVVSAPPCAEMVKGEEWREIPGAPGYLLSSMGRVYGRRLRRLHRVIDAGRGYKSVSVLGRAVQLHRLLLIVFDRPPVGGEVARHLDGNPGNNCLENLAWGSHTDNATDREIHGRTVRGGRHGMRKLKPYQVRAIHVQYAKGETITTLARRYGVKRAPVRDILKGRNWRHVHPENDPITARKLAEVRDARSYRYEPKALKRDSSAEPEITGCDRRQG